MIDREMRGSHERCEKKVPFLALLDSLTRFVFDGKKAKVKCVQMCSELERVCELKSVVIFWVLFTFCGDS